MIRTPHLAAAAAVALSACSTTDGPPTRRNIDVPGTSLAAVYSNGVLVGNTLYLSGRLGLDPETGAVPEEVEDEVRNIMDGLAAVLAEADMTTADLVSVTVFCSDPSLYDRFNAVYRTYFDGAFPSRAFVGSGPLLRDANFEVKGIAVRSR